MFGTKCEQCGQKLVRLIDPKSYGNYLMCPNVYQSMLANFKRENHRIYCCGRNEDKSKAKNPKRGNCIYCDEKLLGLVLMKPFTLYHVCPTVLGFFLYAYKTKQKALKTEIHCRTKTEVEAKLKDHAVVTLARGVSNCPLSKIQLTNNADSAISNLRMRVDAPRGWIALVTPDTVSVVPTGGSCSFEIRLSIPKTTEPGEYFIRYGPHAEKLGETKLGPDRALKINDLGSPSIVKVVVI